MSQEISVSDLRVVTPESAGFRVTHLPSCTYYIFFCDHLSSRNNWRRIERILIKSDFGEYYKELVWYFIIGLVRAIVTTTLHEHLHAFLRAF